MKWFIGMSANRSHESKCQHGLFTGKSNFYQPSTSGMEQSRSMCVFDESQAGSGEHAVIGAKENQFVTQRTDDRVCNLTVSSPHYRQYVLLVVLRWPSSCKDKVHSSCLPNVFLASGTAYGCKRSFVMDLNKLYFHRMVATETIEKYRSVDFEPVVNLEDQNL